VYKSEVASALNLTTVLHLVLRMGLSVVVTACPRAPSHCAQRQYSVLMTLQTEAAKHVAQILTKATSNITVTSV